MNKVKSNALWNELTGDQLKALDQWLFEEKQSYETVWKKAQAQFKYKGSYSSLRRYFLRRRKERATEEFRDLRDEVAAVSSAAANPATVYQATEKLLAMFLFRQLRRSPEDMKEALSVAKLIVQNDYNELLREMKAEDQKLRREAIEFGKEKFRYDMIENAVKALPELQKVAEAMGEADSTRYRESTNKAKQIMFAPDPKVLPENGQEEAEMLEAKKKREGEENVEEQKIVGAATAVAVQSVPQGVHRGEGEMQMVDGAGRMKKDQSE
jgi:hypothetical protein